MMMMSDWVGWWALFGVICINVVGMPCCMIDIIAIADSQFKNIELLFYFIQHCNGLFIYRAFVGKISILCDIDLANPT